MKLTNKTKFILIILLLIINIILRFQAIPYERGFDTFEMHIMADSLSEFGFAKWVLHPLSFFGQYPASYSSSVLFLLSGISQLMDTDIESFIFTYGVLIGLLSIFTAYLMAGEIFNDDIFKILVAFGISTSPAILGYTTWTIPTRGLFLVCAPLLIYALLRCRKSFKHVPFLFLFTAFLFSTHHLFYLLIPAFCSFFILISYRKFKKHIYFLKAYIPAKLTPYIIIIGFLFMFSIPFFTGRFIEDSRYSPIYFNYLRYIGILIIPAIGGAAFLLFKHDKNFNEWFILLNLLFLTTLVYRQTYMKGFIPIIVILLAGMGLVNIVSLHTLKKYTPLIFGFFLITSIIFSGYYQFLHDYSGNPYFGRTNEESTYKTGLWMKENMIGSAISNDVLLGLRIFSASETTHVLTSITMIDQIYGFVKINISEYKRYPLTEEDFWFSGYEGRDLGQDIWKDLVLLRKSMYDLNITYIVENTRTNGRILWNHGMPESKLLQHAYSENICIYHNGNSKIWM